MVAVDLAISKEVDAFHPHKQARLYGIATALSQCPQGNSPVPLPSGAEGAHIWLLPVRPLAALTTWQGRHSPFHRGSSLLHGRAR